MVISEAAGLFIIPFFLTLGGNIWALLNETGIIFIPFAIIVVVSFFEARVAGDSAGSPAVLSIKLIESRFYSMLVVLVIGAMPWGVGEPEFTFKQFSTKTDPSWLSGVENMDDLRPNSLFSDMYGGTHPPLLFGVIQNLTVGTNGALTAKIPCTIDTDRNTCVTDVDFSIITQHISDIKAKSVPLQKVTSDFNRQCHVKAINQVLEAESLGRTLSINTKVYPNNTNARLAFFSPLMQQVYLGTHIAGKAMDPMTMKTSVEWEQSHHQNTVLGCRDAANELTRLLEVDYAKQETEKDWLVIRGLKTLLSLYHNSDNSSLVPSPTEAQARTEIINSMYANTIAAYELEVGNVNKNISWFGLPDFSMPTYESISDAIGDVIVDTSYRVTWAFSSIDQWLKLQVYQAIAPTAVVLIQGLILMVLPLLMVLSSYNMKLLYHLAVFYFSLGMTGYVQAVGETITTILHSMHSNPVFNLNPMAVIDGTEVYTIGLMATLLLSGLWVVLIQMIANTAGNQVNALVEDFSKSATSEKLTMTAIRLHKMLNKGGDDGELDDQNDSMTDVVDSDLSSQH